MAILTIRSLYKNCVYFIHHLWILTGTFGTIALVRLLAKVNESRSSLTTNREILETLEPTSTALSFAIFGMIISLVGMRRKLKHGTIRRLGIHWKRVLLGAIIPLAVPTFLIRDIERLSQLPRNEMIEKERIRVFKASRKSILWPVLVAIQAQVSSPLNNALLGIVYVTEGTASLSDPKRYIFKWIQPQIFTDALDKYSQYIWIGSIFYCIMAILISVVSWLLLRKCSLITRQALS